MTAVLLHTKLCAPPLRPGLVARPQLFERLNQGLRPGCKLILLSAPAGFGKTTLLVDWLQRGSDDVAWLSLDEGDNDPARFLRYLVAALQDVNPEIGQEAQAILQAPQAPPVEAVLASLLNDVEAVDHPAHLILDDYHLIHTLSIHEMLAFLLNHLPARMRLVLSTREDPPLALPRLRARAQICEVRQGDLQFSPQETASFIRETMHLELAAEDIYALQQRTEGWITGLQLAALSLQGSADATQQVRTLTGSHSYILDYLIHEVFSQQSPEIQQFLLHTSILERLTAPLCDALTGRTDGRQTLPSLERSNLFVERLDNSRQWYRYHRLFADLLRHRLQIEQGGQFAALHRRASEWYAQNRYPEDAVRHALEASDWERAANLLDEAATALLNQGQMTTLLRWYRSLPEAELRSRPRLCYQYSWLLLLTEQIEPALEYLALAEAAAQGDKPFMGQIAVWRAYLARLQGDGRRVIELSQRALSLLADDDLESRAVAALNVGIAQWYRGDLDEAAQALDEAEQAAAQTENDYVHTSALIFATRLQAARAKMASAAQTYRRLIQSRPHVPTIALARVDLAKLLIEWNDLSSAAEQAQRGLEQSERNADPEIQLAALSVLAYTEQLLGQQASAQALLERQTSLMQHPGLSPFAQLHALGYRALTALAANDLDQAAGTLGQAPPLDHRLSVPESLLLSLAQARLLLAQDQTQEAAHVLAARHTLATQAGFEASLVETHAMLALCPSPAEDATAHLAQALELGSASGHVRAFLDLGQPMAEHLRWAMGQGMEAKYAHKLLAAFQGNTPQAPGTLPQPASTPQPLLEPLSEREIAVLRLLVQGHTYQEVSQALYVSLNTVKTHIRHIYAKLQVHTRRQAIAKARELGVL